tara:strand:- start:259 stop:480 length:222 start_codon:yes stop_codon:yes gene_type:complete
MENLTTEKAEMFTMNEDTLDYIINTVYGFGMTNDLQFPKSTPKADKFKLKAIRENIKKSIILSPLGRIEKDSK